jgi:cyanophycinase
MTLAGGPKARLRFITGATNEPDSAERAYTEAMRSIGAENVSFVHLTEAADSSHPDLLSELQAADGVFITGGDQGRLMAKLWSTPVMKVLHDGFRERGLCVAGTSAGAAAMSRAMIAQGPAVVVPQKDAVSLDLGLNFLPQALVDQHFSQRRRLPRLLSALAQRPDLIGVGIDEDTALLLDGGRGLEVIGRSSVTIVDGLDLQTNWKDIGARERLEMIGVNLHVVPAGRRYRHPTLGADPDEPGLEPPPALRAVVAKLLEPPPILVL